MKFAEEKVRFEDLILGFDEALPIGYKRMGENLVINPPKGSETANVYLYPNKDCLIYLADDEKPLHFVEPSAMPLLDESFDLKNRMTPERKSVLVFGIGFKAEIVINQLLGFLAAGSEITCSDTIEQKIKAGYLKNNVVTDVKVHFRDMKIIDTALSRLIEGRGGDFDLIIFAEEVLEPYNFDARSLMCLAGINSAFNKCDKKPRIVMELFDSNNVELAQAANADDVIIGSELLSNYLVQIVREPERHSVFAELLAPKGSEIYIKPITLYKTDENAISFKELMAAARNRNEIAIGYAYEEGLQFKYAVNPPVNQRNEKNNHIQLAIVLAEGAY